MQRATPGLAIVALALLVTACEFDRISFGDTAGSIRERWDPWIATDRTMYTAWYTAQTIELDIGFTFRNQGRESVAVPRCTSLHQPALDKLVGGEWVEVLPAPEACWGSPVIVGAGRSLDVTYRVRAGRPNTAIQPQFLTTNIPGTYRLRWQVYEVDPFSQFGIGAPLPLEHRVSNEFRISQ